MLPPEGCPSLPRGSRPDPPSRRSSSGRWAGNAGAAEGANERYSAQLQKGGRGASAADVYASQRGEIARLEGRSAGDSGLDSSPTTVVVVSLAAASAAGLDPWSAAGRATIYSTSNGPSPYYARPLQGTGGPLRDGYGKIIKEENLAKGMQRRAEQEQLSGSRKSSFNRKASSASRC